MNNHLIVGHFGPNDYPDTSVAPGEVLTRVDLLSPEGHLEFGADQALRELAAVHVYPSETGIDLLLFAILVQLADTRISRSVDSQDTWTREIRLVVPVVELERWNCATTTVKRILDFLTGDRWTIEFRSRPTDVTIGRPTPPTAPVCIPFNSLSLFSGGLDSLIGVIDMLNEGLIPLLVSHAGDGATSDAQTACFDALQSRFASQPFARLRYWLNFPKTFVVGNRTENTTRGRSFLFFAIGAFAGTGFASSFTLRVPENGLIAINVPMDHLRLGSLSTRTTHPFYIARWNELLATLGLAGHIENPYWNKTKGEMAMNCTDQSLLRQLAPHSLSCSSPAKGRWAGRGIEHCGYCLPCLIRQAALTVAWGKGNDPTSYGTQLGTQTLDTRRAEGRQVRSFQYASARLKSKPGIERILIHKPGSLSDVAGDLEELADVYRRGLLEVDALVSNVKARPS